MVHGCEQLFEWLGSLIMSNAGSLAVMMHGVTSYQWPTYWRSARDSVTVPIEGGSLGFALGNVIGFSESSCMPQVAG